jgi:hypothetical protein
MNELDPATVDEGGDAGLNLAVAGETRTAARLAFCLERNHVQHTWT